MADVNQVDPTQDGRISAMPLATNPADTDFVPIVTKEGAVQTNKRVTLDTLRGRDAYNTYAKAETDAGRTPLALADWLASLKGKDGDDGKSAYALYVDSVPAGQTPLSETDWLASLKAKDGLSAYAVYAKAETDAGRTPKSQADWLTSLVGAEGKSAYQVYADAETAAGRTPKAEADWQASLVGLSAYQVYAKAETDAGRTPLSQADWLASLKAKDGKDGLTAYAVYAKAETDAGRTPKSEADWLVSLQGKSAYDVYVAGVPQGQTPLSQADWLTSLKAKDGLSAYAVYAKAETDAGRTPLSQADWLTSLKGKDGSDGTAGLTAYEVYAKAETDANRTPLSLVDWLASLKAKDGKDGLTAYQVYAKAETDAGRTPLSQADWLTSLKGKAGAIGTGLNFIGTLAESDEFPPAASLSKGDAFVKGTHFWMNDGTEWVDLGDFGGKEGKSAYDLYVAAATAKGETPMVEADWLKSLQGPPGVGINVRGELPNITSLPASGQTVGDTYVIQGYQHIWVGVANSLDGTGWSVVGVPGPQGKSAYQSYLDTTADNPKKSEADWLASLVGPQGVGKEGPTGPQGAGIVVVDELANQTALAAADKPPVGHGYVTLDNNHYNQWNGTKYVDLGVIRGVDGKSTYQLYVETVPQGTTPLSETDWLASLKGNDGKSAYEVYLATTTDNPKLSQTDWLASLKVKGDKGSDGDDAYEVYVSTVAQGQTPLSKVDWLASLKVKGDQGDSAYDVYVSTVPNGTTPLTKAEWLTSLKGKDINTKGEKATVGDLPTDAAQGDGWFVGTDLYVSTGVSGQWINAGQIKGDQGKQGEQGPDGKSAYQVYFDLQPVGTALSEADWVVSLKGKQGDIGPDGLSAYAVYAKAETDAGRTPLSQSDWLAGLKGSAGKAAYQSYLDTTTDNPKKSESAWVASLTGPSAYAAYVATTSDNPVLTQAQWVASLKGTNGLSAYQVYAKVETDAGRTPLTQAQWLTSLIGSGIIPKGVVADQATLQAVANPVVGWMYFIGTHMWIYGVNSSSANAWLDMGDLSGPKGQQGDSAYDRYKASVPSGSAALSEADWLASLKGKQGDQGAQGAPTTLKGTVADLTALQALTGMAQGDTYLLTSPAGDMYSYVGSPLAWKYIGNILGPQGIQGPMGPGIAIIGSLSSQSDLTSAPQAAKGEGYVISGEFWGWTGTEYQNMGKIQGPTGPQGIQGKAGPTGPQGIQGIQGQRGSVIIMFPRAPNAQDGIINDVFQNTATQEYFQKTTDTAWTLMGVYGGGNVNDASHDGLMKVRQDGNWVNLPVLEAPTDPSNTKAVMVRNPTTKAWQALDRLDLKIIDATATTTVNMDLSKAQVYKIDGTKANTLTVTNLPATDRMINIVVVVKGSGASMTWPTQLKWSNGTIPTFGALRTEIIMSWDGEILMGAAGPTIAS